MHVTYEIVNYAFEVNHSCNRYNKKPVLSVSQSQVFFDRVMAILLFYTTKCTARLIRLIGK